MRNLPLPSLATLNIVSYQHGESKLFFFARLGNSSLCGWDFPTDKKTHSSQILRFTQDRLLKIEGLLRGVYKITTKSN